MGGHGFGGENGGRGLCFSESPLCSPETDQVSERRGGRSWGRGFVFRVCSRGGVFGGPVGVIWVWGVRDARKRKRGWGSRPAPPLALPVLSAWWPLVEIILVEIVLVVLGGVVGGVGRPDPVGPSARHDPVKLAVVHVVPLSVVAR
jgi:hypothetical protein